MNFAFLGNYTLDLLARTLEKELQKAGVDSELYIGGFNQYAQDILNTDSALYGFEPEVIVISLDLNRVLKDIADKIMEVRYPRIRQIGLERLKGILSLLERLSAQLPTSLILVDNFYLPPKSVLGLLEYNSPFSLKEVPQIFNLRLAGFVKKLHNVKIVDVKSLIELYGSEALLDSRLHYIAKMPWSNTGLQKIAEIHARAVKAHLGRRKKCVLLDLDNTLWGGIIGDDGIENILLSNDGEGQAFYDFQQGLLKLYQRGVLLAICSKNSEEIALNAIENHPYMVLRPEHFAAKRINWENKAKNILEIAQELNIGLESMVFLDDSPFERSLIRDQLKQVETPDLPEDPSHYAEFLAGLDYFDFFSLTEDDLKRSQMYKQNIQRKELLEVSTDLEGYLRSLEMVALIGRVEPMSLSRVAQLTQKTNQFNLTTRRYTEADIWRFQDSEDHRVYHLRLQDKFGDNGIVGVCVVWLRGQAAVIDTFLMSCRVLGRDVEKAFLAYVYEQMKALGKKDLVGEFIPTTKNRPSASLYEDLGFREVEGGKWQLDLDTQDIKRPEWIRIEEV